MEKLEKILPEKIPIAGRKVIVSEETFNKFIKTLELHTQTINDIIDALAADANAILKLQESVKSLAQAIETLVEE